MPNEIQNGARREISGKPCVYYDGYWIKYYEPPKDSLAAKKLLIDALTHRLFNHVEHGINIPGYRLNQAREAYESEADPAKKRVKGAMLAGSLFNRAADIFRKLVELQEFGVTIDSNNSLMRECGNCLMEALEFGRSVKHINGDECIDELWGEPFKAFSIPVEDFYVSRYIKMSQAMRDIDKISEAMIYALNVDDLFPDINWLVIKFGEAAKVKCETLRSDPVIFDVWSTFVAAAESLSAIKPNFTAPPSEALLCQSDAGLRLIEEGKTLLTHISRARVAMPKSTQGYLMKCNSYHSDSIKAKESLKI